MFKLKIQGAVMLIELQQVEVFIEPNDILIKALEEGDISIDRVISECINEEGAEAVLDAIDNHDIKDYVEKYELHQDVDIDMYEQVLQTIKEFSQTDKAKLLWQLLNCKEV